MIAERSTLAAAEVAAPCQPRRLVPAARPQVQAAVDGPLAAASPNRLARPRPAALDIHHRHATTTQSTHASSTCSATTPAGDTNSHTHCARLHLFPRPVLLSPTPPLFTSRSLVFSFLSPSIPFQEAHQVDSSCPSCVYPQLAVTALRVWSSQCWQLAQFWATSPARGSRAPSARAAAWPPFPTPLLTRRYVSLTHSRF